MSGRDDREIGWWRSFSEFLKESNQLPDLNTATTDTTATSWSSNNNSLSNGNSWSETEFTADILQSSRGNFESLSVTDGNEGKNSSPDKVVSNKIGIAAGEDSVNHAKLEDLANEEGKEQLSPVSVPDNRFDEEEKQSPPFQGHHARVEGTDKQKLMQTIRRFHNFAQLEPVHLEKQLALSEMEDEPPDTMSIDDQDKSVDIDETNNEDKITEAEDLLKLFKVKIPSNKLKLKVGYNLVLLDFFRERIVEDSANIIGGREFGMETLKMAEEWLNRHSLEVILVWDWEVKDGRKSYLNEMEKNGR